MHPRHRPPTPDAKHCRRIVPLLSVAAAVFVLVQAGLGAAVVLLRLRAGLVTTHLGMSLAVVAVLLLVAVQARRPTDVVRGHLAGVEVDQVTHLAVVDEGDGEQVADLAAQHRSGHGAVEGPQLLSDAGCHLARQLRDSDRDLVDVGVGCGREPRVAGLEPLGWAAFGSKTAASVPAVGPACSPASSVSPGTASPPPTIVRVASMPASRWPGTVQVRV